MPKTNIWVKIKSNFKQLGDLFSKNKRNMPTGLPSPDTHRYELTNETFEIQTGTKPITLYRVRALTSFAWKHPYENEYRVQRGDLGGFVEKRENLDEFSNAWVAENAMVYGEAVVTDKALVRGQASISGYASIGGNALIKDLVAIKDFAKVEGTAVIYDAITIEDETKIRSDYYISGDKRVRVNKDSPQTVFE